MMAWIKLSNHNGYDGIISMSGVKYRLMIDPAYNPYYDAGSWDDQVVPGFTFDPPHTGTWYHYGITVKANGDAKIYVNGVVVHTSNQGGRLALTDCTIIYIGTG